MHSQRAGWGARLFRSSAWCPWHPGGRRDRSQPASRLPGMRHGHLRDAPVLVLAAALLSGIGILAAQRVLCEAIETSLVDATVMSMDRDARRLARRWEAVWDQAVTLQGLAEAVTLARRDGDAAAQDRALTALRDGLAAAPDGIAGVVAIGHDGSPAWSEAGHHPLLIPQGIAQPPPMGRAFRTTAIVDPGGRVTLNFIRTERDGGGQPLGSTVVVYTPDPRRDLPGVGPGCVEDIAMLLRDRTDVLVRGAGGVGGAAARIDQATFARAGNGGPLVRRGPDPIDGTARIGVLRDVGGDLSFALETDEAAALRDVPVWRRRIRLAGTVLMGLVLCAAIVALRRIDRAREARGRSLAEEASRARDALLRQIADHSQDIVGIIDQDFRFVFVNEAVRDVLGVPPSDLVGRVAGGLVHPEGRETVRAALRSIAGTRRSCRVSAPYLRPDGRIVWIEYQLCPIQLPDLNGAPSHGWVSIGRDVTARHLAEEDLRRAHEELRIVAESTPAILYRKVWGPDNPGLILFASMRDRTFLGFEEQVWRAPGFFATRLHPDDVTRYHTYREGLERVGIGTAEVRVLHADGHYLWLRLGATCVAVDGGGFDASGYAADVTAERLQATELSNARRLLALGDLASGIGHEIAQPLATIALTAEGGIVALTRDPMNTPRARETFERILNMTRRAGEIIRRMREIGHPEDQEVVLTRLADVVSDALSVVGERLREEGVAVRVDMPAGLASVVVAPLLIQQVVINLIANACDAWRDAAGAAPGPRVIDVTGRERDGAVVLSVRDRAGGIPPGILDRVFEPFFTTKRPGKGTGLGLSLCHRIIRQAGGTLTARNEGEGAVFEIALPIPAANAVRG